PAKIRVIPRAPQNCVLAEESRKRWNTGDCNSSHQKSPIRPWHVAPQSAHFPDILNASRAVNHTACSKEQQRLEKRMRHQVEHARGIRPGSACQEHVSELADGGIGENLLDIRLHEANR